MDRLLPFQRDFVLPFVGVVSPYRLVCRGFVPDDYVKYIKFDPHCTEDSIVSVLNDRRTLRMIDFTGSLYLTTPFFRRLYFRLDSVTTFILDRCDRIRFRQCSCVSTRMRFDREGKTVIVSLRGCWYNFPEPLYSLTAMDTAELVMCAMNSGTSQTKRVLFDYFDGRVSLLELEYSLLIRNLVFFRNWRILSVTYVHDHAGVVMFVKGYGLLVFHLMISMGCWKVLELFTTDIVDVWFRTSL